MTLMFILTIVVIVARFEYEADLAALRFQTGSQP
jgi:hypothetical protein